MNTFKKEQLSELLLLAQGDRTREKFAQDAGISLTQISKLVKQESNGAPRPDTLLKIAKVADNIVSSLDFYDELMAACGYLQPGTGEKDDLEKTYPNVCMVLRKYQGKLSGDKEMFIARMLEATIKECTYLNEKLYKR